MVVGERERRREEREGSEGGKGTLGEVVEEGRMERRRPSWGGEGWRVPVESGMGRFGEGWSWETVWRTEGRRGTGRAAPNRGRQQRLTGSPG